MEKIEEIFGCNVFNGAAMKKWLPETACAAMNGAVNEGTPLTGETAEAVAEGMKNWAIDKGATHFTHWFQPMTGITAEKHEAFIYPSREGGAITRFSGKELIKGESDASSFPSGGLRATFEARGYTAWDPASYAFVKDGTLYIPSAFCSFDGASLDKKTPLLRSMDAVDKQAKRVLKLFGKEPKRVIPNVGAEQEYFLIARELYEKRQDLKFCGRTLFGAPPAKGQEHEGHYYGNIKDKVKAFMRELDAELWRVGVYAKTEHNETAPCQHELAPVYTTCNIATDHNQLTMEFMKKVAARHGLACLLHEKPFMSVSGSGKHNNWSLAADGENLLKPGRDPQNNLQFLIFLIAAVKAADEYQDLLRLSVASAANDLRLGGNEAPPAIISVYLGQELTEILEYIADGKPRAAAGAVSLKIGAKHMPDITQDASDRNRTSPFAFTGNKFEFRMVGSAMNIACPTFVLNTIAAAALNEIADRLEGAGAAGFDLAAKALIKEYYQKHRRIIFNGNNYTEEWRAEAKRRGLSDLKTTPDAIPCYIKKESVELFGRQNVLNAAELSGRYEILLDSYVKTITIESRTMAQMARREIMPAAIKYCGALGGVIAGGKSLNEPAAMAAETALFNKISLLVKKADALTGRLEKQSAEITKARGVLPAAEFCRDIVLSRMEKLRAVCDTLETLVAKEYWPFPTYNELLFTI